MLWEMQESLPLLMEGREGGVFSILLRVRYSDNQSVRTVLLKFSCPLELTLSVDTWGDERYPGLLNC